MKESILKTDKNIVFRETFGSEDLVRANGGTPTAVTFSDGNGSFLLSSASRIFYNKIFSGTGSVRIKCKPTSFATLQVLFDFRDNTASPSGAYGYLNATTGQIAYAAGGTIYNRGIPSTTSYLNSDNDIVITGISLSNLRFAIGSNYATLFNFTGSIELFEIYKGTLTANEVKNLYENRQNKEINTAQNLQLGTELVVNANDRGFESGTTGNWNGSYKSTSFSASTEQAHSGTYSAKYVSDGTGAGEVRLSNTGNNYVAANTEGGYITAWVYSSLAGVTMSGRGLGNTSYVSSASTTINGWQQLTVFVPDGVYATTSYAVWFTIPSGATVYIDDVSWKKTLNNTTKEILRVDARNGVIANKYSGSVTSTDLVSGWDFTNWTPTNATINDLDTFTTTSSGGWIVKSFLTIGKQYRIYISGTKGSGDLRFWDGASNVYKTITDNAFSERFDITATSVYIFLRLMAIDSVNITSLTVNEVIPSVTPTAVSVVRDGNVYAMSFNGSSSIVDCGSYDTLVGNKTFIAWVKHREISTTTITSRIIDNGKYVIFTDGVNLRYRMTNNGASPNIWSADNVIKIGVYHQLIVTRTSTGITNFYINGALSGSANQTGDTVTAGTNNISIGGNSVYFKGQISNVRIYDGILSTQEITQIWQSEKGQYNL